MPSIIWFHILPFGQEESRQKQNEELPWKQKQNKTMNFYIIAHRQILDVIIFFILVLNLQTNPTSTQILYCLYD